MRARSRRAVLPLAVAAVAACGGGPGQISGPRVDLIDDAVEAIEGHYGAPQRYFEIVATADRVTVVVAVDDATAAESGGITADGGFTIPEPVGPASGETFDADAIEFDPDAIFDGLRAELADPDIVDFAILGGSDGSVVYDATVASASGGVLLVLLGPDGVVLGVQAA